MLPVKNPPASRAGWCVVVALTCLGCVTTTSSLAFRGGQLPHGDSTSAATLSAEGWVVAKPPEQWLSIQIANQGASSVHLSYVADKYTAKTRDGRTVVLETTDFLNYPSAIPPGSQGVVTLLVPKDVLVHELARIVATLNMGRTVVVLEPIGAGVSVVPPASAPILPEDDGAPVPMFRRSGGPVPVVVEFQQELGTTLNADVRWDDAGDVMTLASGSRQTFYVVPGQHRLYVKSQLPFIATTAGHVPIAVKVDEPLRVIVDGRATLSGVELRVRVRNRAGTVSEQIIRVPPS